MRKANAVVLEQKGELAIRKIALQDQVGADDVKISIHTVGICGSDVHYYTHGRIGDFYVREPMVLGHEGSGTVIEIGENVRNLSVGDRVCMEPGVPDMSSRSSRLGQYNVDPAVTFWATPPDHGILTKEVVHPAEFTYRLPDSVSFSHGAMVEPLAVGVHAARKASVAPGDVAAVIGAGTIGILTALAALAGGCSQVYITDVSPEKLEIARAYSGIIPIDVRRDSLNKMIVRDLPGWGVDVVFEASGAPSVYHDLIRIVRPGGKIVLVGLPPDDIQFDVNAAISKELTIETVFRYTNVFERALLLISSGKVDLEPLITKTFQFNDSVAAFERAAEHRPGDVKLQILVS